jgi:uncharacterized protein YecT (DUF1311 family)
MRRVSKAIVLVAAALGLASVAAAARDGQPTARQVKSVRECVDRHAGGADAVERECLFKLVAEPCIERTKQSNAEVIGCYDIELKIWDELLNETYQALRAELDAERQAKLRELQQAWIAYRDTTCDFYWHKIQGTMAGPMGAACRLRETARRAILLELFRNL